MQSKKMTEIWQLNLGATPDENGITKFKVWAPFHLSLSVQVEGKTSFPMLRDNRGYFLLETDKITCGDRYYYRLENGLLRPDPVSRSLPNGVHGPTEIIDPSAFMFTDEEWKGIDLRECIFYEVHVGTFSSKGTFEGLLEKLDYFVELGVNCIEVMPIAQFPGRWNWGYDGASLYTPYEGYGGAVQFKEFVNACHLKGIAVCLDVVYNHLGPEGNYLTEFGPYLSQTYHTPWGKALNYDRAYSDSVREYVIKNALYWICEYHVDILRLDALQGIFDFSAIPMLHEMMEEVQQLSKKLGRQIYVVAESDLNDARVLKSPEKGGWNLHGLWNDDFHHTAHVSLTGEQHVYYCDFNGLAHLAKTLEEGAVYTGEYSIFRKKKHGNSFEGTLFEQCIVFLQNHDQIGNRPFGERLSVLIDKERLKVAACMVLMTPAIPFLFMGEEYGEKAPFEYFVDYSDEGLMRSIYEGRKKEFRCNNMPFPGKESFINSCLTWNHDQEVFSLYQTLIALRKKHLPKKGLRIGEVPVYLDVQEEWIAWEYPTDEDIWLGVLCHLGKKTLQDFSLPFKHIQEAKVEVSTQKLKQGRDKKWQVPSECGVIVM